MFAIKDNETGVLLHKKGQIILFKDDIELQNYLTLFVNFSMQMAAAHIQEDPFLPMAVQRKFQAGPWEKIDADIYHMDNTIKYSDLNL